MWKRGSPQGRAAPRRRACCPPSRRARSMRKCSRRRSSRVERLPEGAELAGRLERLGVRIRAGDEPRARIRDGAAGLDQAAAQRDEEVAVALRIEPADRAAVPAAIESLVAHYPFRVVTYRLRRGSGGAGRFPGGEGIEREIEFLEPATLSLMGERRRLQPWGLNGGQGGACGEDWLHTAHGAERLPGKCTVEVEAGDRLRVLTPGGGGWG